MKKKYRRLFDIIERELATERTRREMIEVTIKRLDRELARVRKIIGNGFTTGQYQDRIFDGIFAIPNHMIISITDVNKAILDNFKLNLVKDPGTKPSTKVIPIDDTGE